MIASVLDGAGPLRSVDAWPLLRPAVRDTIRMLSASGAEAIARSQGSIRFVRGQIFSSGDSTIVALELWDLDSATVIGRARVGGIGGGAAHTDLWRIMLRAVNEILPTLIPGSPPNALAGWEDRNPAAIASFLVGEGAFRRAQFATALDKYRDAVRADSLFALAAIRGAQAAAWKDKQDEAAEFVKLAQRAKLPPRYAHFASGYQQYLSGNADSAVTLLRAAIADDRMLAVAWTQIGETFTHLLPRQGSPDSLARDAFDHAIALDSNATALFHPIQLAMRRGDVDDARRMLARFEAAQPDSALLRHAQIMMDCVRHGSAKVAWQQLALTRPLPLVGAGFSLAAGGAQLVCSAAAFEQILAVDTSAKDAAADGRRWAALMGLVGIRLAQGRSRDAASAIDAYNRRWQYGASLFLLTGPMDSVMAPRARAIARADSALYGATYARMPWIFRLWEIGQWKLHDGDVTVADTIAHDLSRRADSTRQPLDRVLAQSLSARVALVRGDSTRALLILETIVPTRLPNAVVQWQEMGAAAGERLLYARLLLARGQPARALEIANVVNSPAASIHLLFLPASLQLRLAAASQLGGEAEKSLLRRRIAALRMQ